MLLTHTNRKHWTPSILICPQVCRNSDNNKRTPYFLPRDAMRKRGLRCRPVSVRLAVRPSGWCIVSTRLKISSIFLFGLVAYHSSFCPQRRYPIPRGTHSAGAQKQGVGKICDFRRKIAGSMVAMER